MATSTSYRIYPNVSELPIYHTRHPFSTPNLHKFVGFICKPVTILISLTILLRYPWSNFFPNKAI